jgi:C-terminal processing protease CtpA/Prc
VRSFTFRAPPQVETVEDGTPAARAGLRRGDRLTHVDGLALTTPGAWRRFGAIKPGERVEWTYTRDGSARTVPMLALRRPDAGARTRAAASSQRLRYSGAIGDAEVEVRGAPVTVTRDERTGETVIRSSDLTVRIRPDR